MDSVVYTSQYIYSIKQKKKKLSKQNWGKENKWFEEHLQ